MVPVTLNEELIPHLIQSNCGEEGKEKLEKGMWIDKALTCSIVLAQVMASFLFLAAVSQPTTAIAVSILWLMILQISIVSSAVVSPILFRRPHFIVIPFFMKVGRT